MAEKQSKKELIQFLDEVDSIVERMETHPSLSNYYIGVVDQLKNINIVARRNVEK